MHTNNAMLRHFWWATNALWPSDLEAKQIPASIMVSEHDEIVPSAEVEELFRNYNLERKEVKEKSSNDIFSFFSGVEHEKKSILRANMLHGANHGEFVFNDKLRDKVVHTVLAMMRLNSITERKKTSVKR